MNGSTDLGFTPLKFATEEQSPGAVWKTDRQVKPICTLGPTNLNRIQLIILT